MSALNDPEVVRREYADESRFAVRAGAWARSTGPSAIEICRDAVAEVAPGRVLEVGPGRGETAEWIARETGAEVVAVDQSGAKSQTVFNGENGEEILRRSFSAVERRDADGYAMFEPREAIAYIEASEWLWTGGPTPKITEPIRVTKAPVVFVATK